MTLAPGVWGQSLAAAPEAQGLEFDGGSRLVDVATTFDDHFYRVDVPAGALGWDVRITDVTGPQPSQLQFGLMVRRGELPAGRFVETTATELAWPVGHQEVLFNDATLRPENHDGSIREDGLVQTWGLGNILEPGTYYLSVRNRGNNAAGSRYRIASRGVGAGYSLPVRELAFAGGTVSVADLAARDLAFFAVRVPSGMPSWRLRLEMTSGEALLGVLKDKIPSARLLHNGNAASVRSPGKRMQKPGHENYLLLPLAGSSFVEAGLYYVMVVSEGQASATNRSRIGLGASSFKLTSVGPQEVIALGTLGAESVERADAIEGGDTKIYRFSVPIGAAGLEIRMDDRIGNPTMLAREGEGVPDPGMTLGAVTLRDQYGVEAGELPKYASPNLIVVPNPTPGVWTLTVKAKTTVDQFGPYPDAAYKLRLRTLPVDPLNIDGGRVTVTDQPVGGWSFFRVEVPADVLGWDLRLQSVTSGLPRVVVRRDRPPVSLLTEPWASPATATNWVTGNQWAAGADFTRRSSGADGVTNEDGRILTFGMGQPLEAGTYYIGVHNNAGAGPQSYTLTSRAIGAGRALPVAELAYAGGTATLEALDPRESAYFRVQVPSNAPSWSVLLEGSAGGEGMLVVNKDRIASVGGGRVMQKVGAEHYVMLPPAGQTNLAGGTYYLSVVSEGSSATNAQRIGWGPARLTLRSEGPLPVLNLGLIEGNGVIEPVSLDGGQVQAFQFELPTNGLNHEVVLEDRSGAPFATVRPGTLLPDPGFVVGLSGPDPYGHDGGANSQLLGSDTLVTIPASTNTLHTLVIKARARSGVATEAALILRVRPIVPEVLAFEGTIPVTEQAAGTWRYFSVEVPAGVAGWDLRTRDVAGGAPLLVVSRDRVPIGSRTQPWATPWSETTWAAGNQWAADVDWTGRALGVDGVTRENGRILAMGLGRPLAAGRYFVGVLNNSPAGAVSYALSSRGIGGSTGIAVRELPFVGGEATGTGLAVRDAAYYKVTVPDGVTGWRLQLENVSGESTLAVLKDVLPNVGATPAYDVLGRVSAGRRVQKDGGEQFVLMAGPTVTNLGGTYYLAVIAEGQNATNAQRIGTGTSDFRLRSEGEVERVDLGALSGEDLTRPDVLAGGEVKFYRFEAPAGLASLEARLEDRTGNPVMTLVAGDRFPAAGAGLGAIVAEPYGVEGGFTPLAIGTNSITLANPAAGPYTLAVMARRAPQLLTEASYVLRVKRLGAAVLAFDGAPAVPVEGQAPGSWNYFEVNVPATALGWDLRLLSVTSGRPRIVVSRETLPDGLRTGPWTGPGDKTNWLATNQWLVGADWTRRPNSADGVVEEGQVFAVGMGRPLQAGRYVVGIYNEHATTNAAYVLQSRGIGADLAIPVTDLAFEGGAVTNEIARGREAAYYRVVVPANAPSWKFSVEALAGEVMWAGLKESVPNIDSVSFNRLASGRGGQKSGSEPFVLLPEGTNRVVSAGTYYIAVVAEGAVTNATRIGDGVTRYAIRSYGPVPVVDLQTLGTEPIVRKDTLEGGEVKFYRFALAAAAVSVEARLEDRVGTPVMAMRADGALPDPSVAVSPLGVEPYGTEGGAAPTNASLTLITLPSPAAGVYTLAVKARSVVAGVFSNASYTLRLRQSGTQELGADPTLAAGGVSSSASGLLLDNQRVFYRVTIPAEFQGAPVAGWKLNVSNATGLASVRVRKDAPPSDGVAGMAFTTNAAVIVPPFLTPGTWYIEARGGGSNNFTLSSSLVVSRLPAWAMPAGFVAGDFGDSGVDSAGVALTGDRGLELAAGDYDFYAVQVPTNNAGLLRTHLEALRGAPELYVRTEFPPTQAHGATGMAGSLVERSLTGPGTKVGNWVPLNGKAETALKPGRWYLAVRAVGGSARYRLRVSTGVVQELALDGSVVNQAVPVGDWVYYKLAVPLTAPQSWRLVFSEVSGNAALYLRDTVPPGNGATGNPDVRDWAGDAKNAGPYPNHDLPGTYSFTTPPLRPGSAYFVGFRGNTAAIVSLASSTEGRLPEIPAIEFAGGTVTTNLPVGGVATYRIAAPADAVRWMHRSVHAASVLYFIEQGTLPARGATDDFRSAGVNSTNAQPMLAGWPWVAGQHYFLTVTNTAATAQAFSFTMDGRQGTDDDFDGDGLSDLWEMRYFGALSQAAGGDFDNDGVSNLLELQEGTHPADRTSLRPRLTVVAANGTVDVQPPGTNFTAGTVVTLTPTAAAGYYFAHWTNHFVGSDIPAVLTLVSNVNVTAYFRLIGDDFARRIPLTGTSNRSVIANAAATKETGEPRHAGNAGGKSVWWSWVAPASGTANLTTLGSSLNTLVAVYTGTSVETLSPAVVSSINRPVSFEAVAGTEYQIAVDGFNGTSGTIQLGLTLETAPEAELRLSAPAVGSDGVFQLLVEGPVGRTVTIEVSSDLDAWNSAGTVTIVAGGVVFRNTGPQTVARRYYRAVVRP